MVLDIKVGVIPLVVCACGETNDGLWDLIKVCAHMSEARDDAVYDSPACKKKVKVKVRILRCR